MTNLKISDSFIEDYDENLGSPDINGLDEPLRTFVHKLGSGLSSSKSSARKHAFNELRLFLRDRKNIAKLDKCQETWTYLAISVWTYMKKEVDSHSERFDAKKEASLKSSASELRYFIKVSELELGEKRTLKGVLKDSLNELFEMICDHLSRQYAMKACGSEYSLMLADYLLENDEYACRLSRKQWEALSSLLISNWMSGSCEDSVATLKAVAQLILHTPSPAFEYAENIFRFFNMVWEREKKETRATQLLLWSMNTMLDQVFMRDSLMALDLISNLFENIVLFWETKTVSVKWSLIKLLRSYLRILLLHNRIESLPGLPTQMSRLSELVIDDIIKSKWHPGNRSPLYKFHADAKTLTGDFIQLAASCLALEWMFIQRNGNTDEKSSFPLFRRISDEMDEFSSKDPIWPLIVCEGLDYLKSIKSGISEVFLTRLMAATEILLLSNDVFLRDLGWRCASSYLPLLSADSTLSTKAIEFLINMPFADPLNTHQIRVFNLIYRDFARPNIEWIALSRNLVERITSSEIFDAPHGQLLICILDSEMSLNFSLREALYPWFRSLLDCKKKVVINRQSKETLVQIFWSYFRVGGHLGITHFSHLKSLSEASDSIPGEKSLIYHQLLQFELTTNSFSRSDNLSLAEIQRDFDVMCGLLPAPLGIYSGSFVQVSFLLRALINACTTMIRLGLDFSTLFKGLCNCNFKFSQEQDEKLLIPLDVSEIFALLGLIVSVSHFLTVFDTYGRVSVRETRKDLDNWLTGFKNGLTTILYMQRNQITDQVLLEITLFLSQHSELSGTSFNIAKLIPIQGCPEDVADDLKWILRLYSRNGHSSKEAEVEQMLWNNSSLAYTCLKYDWIPSTSSKSSLFRLAFEILAIDPVREACVIFAERWSGFLESNCDLERLFMVITFPVMLIAAEHMDLDMEKIFHDLIGAGKFSLNANRPPQEAFLMCLLTCLHGLTNIRILDQALLIMLHIASMTRLFDEIITRVLRTQAQKWTPGDYRKFIQQMMPKILRKWISNRSVEAFPFWISGHESLSRFIEAYFPDLVLALLQEFGPSEVETFLSSNLADYKKATIDFFSVLAGKGLAMCFKENEIELGRHIVSRILAEILGKELYESLLSKRLDAIIGEVFTYLDYRDDLGVDLSEDLMKIWAAPYSMFKESLPSTRTGLVTSTRVRSALDHLTRSLRLDSHESLWTSSPYRAFRILCDLHSRIFSCFDTRERRKLLFSYRYAFLLMQKDRAGCTLIAQTTSMLSGIPCFGELETPWICLFHDILWFSKSYFPEYIPSFMMPVIFKLSPIFLDVFSRGDKRLRPANFASDHLGLYIFKSYISKEFSPDLRDWTLGASYLLSIVDVCMDNEDLVYFVVMHLVRLLENASHLSSRFIHRVRIWLYHVLQGRTRAPKFPSRDIIVEAILLVNGIILRYRDTPSIRLTAERGSFIEEIAPCLVNLFLHGNPLEIAKSGRYLRFLLGSSMGQSVLAHLTDELLNLFDVFSADSSTQTKRNRSAIVNEPTLPPFDLRILVDVCDYLSLRFADDPIIVEMNDLVKCNEKFAAVAFPYVVSSVFKSVQAESANSYISSLFNHYLSNKQAWSLEFTMIVLDCLGVLQDENVFLSGSEPNMGSPNSFNIYRILNVDYFGVSEAALHFDLLPAALFYLEIGLEVYNKRDQMFTDSRISSLFASIYFGLRDADDYELFCEALEFDSCSRLLELKEDWLYRAKLCEIAISTSNIDHINRELHRSWTNAGFIRQANFPSICQHDSSIHQGSIPIQDHYDVPTEFPSLLSTDVPWEINSQKLRVAISERRLYLNGLLSKDMTRPQQHFFEGLFLENLEYICHLTDNPESSSHKSSMVSESCMKRLPHEIANNLTLQRLHALQTLALLRMNNVEENQSFCFSAIGQSLGHIKVSVQKAKVFHALQAISGLKTFVDKTNLSSEIKTLVKLNADLMESDIAWGRGDTRASIKGLEICLSAAENDHTKLANEIPGLHGVSIVKKEALMTAIDHLTRTRNVLPREILDQYAQPLLAELASDLSITDDMMYRAYKCVADFAFIQYRNYDTACVSDQFLAARNIRKQKEAEILECQKALKEASSKDHRTHLEKYVRQLELQCQIDQTEQDRVYQGRASFLRMSIENYLSCCVYSRSEDFIFYKICSLWFQNDDDQLVNEILFKSIADVPSYKMVPLIYQLASRLGHGSTLFQKALDRALMRACVEHPYHTIYSIIFLRNGVAYNQKTPKRKIDEEVQDDKKADHAQTLLYQLSRSTVRTILADIERLCQAYIEFSLFKVPPEQQHFNKSLTIPSNLSLLKLKNLEIAVPTLDIPLSIGGDYSHITTIKRFENTYQLVGGINLPKVIECIGSDGKCYRQLIKGRDDLRQDAVMEQVFDVVNHLLRQTFIDGQRLSIRTYKAIPLNASSGIIEWVDNAVPFGDYLVKSGQIPSAHERYHPDDWKSNACRKKMEEEITRPSSTQYTKLAIFREIEKKFRPVFRYFFWEHYHNPVEWYERRCAYICSVAGNSMLGYVLGLGDRHAQNILIDRNTAEVIHIDLGIAFEQGKMLTTPELVPFRLTRDIVDGMGSLGTQGLFQKSCQRTLSLLRSESETLLTVLDVLKYDPLYRWTVSPLKLAQVQGSTDIETGSILKRGSPASPTVPVSQTNREAERALIRVKEKLQGYEDGAYLSVEGQVNVLIQTAQDPALLCLLYPGWSPWL